MEEHAKGIIKEWFVGLFYSIFVWWNTSSIFSHGLSLKDVEAWQRIIASLVLTFLGARYYVVKTNNAKVEHKHEMTLRTYYESNILSGDQMVNLKQYSEALKFYNQALSLNFDNDKATAKINHVKHLIEIHG